MYVQSYFPDVRDIYPFLEQPVMWVKQKYF